MSVRKIFNASAWYTASTTSSTVTGPSDTSFDSTSLLLTGDVEVDPSFSNVSLLLTGNDLLDKSNTRSTITNTGSVTVSNTVKKFGTGSLAFNGGNYLTAPVSSVFQLGSSDFTIEAWINSNDISTYKNICGSWISGAYSFIFDTWANGILHFKINSNTEMLISSVAIAIGVWNHVAVTRAGSTFYMFLNGIQVATTTNSNAIVTATAPLAVGANADAAYAQNWNGYIDDLRITKGVARYTTNFTPPVKALPTHEILDSSVYRLPVTTYGNARIDTTTKKFGTGSMYFDGTGDYLSTPSNAAFQFGSGDFTIEFWANITSFMGAYDGICGVWNASGFSWYVSVNAYSNTRKLGFSYKIGGTTYDVPIGTATNTTGTWNHFAIVRSGNLLYGFKDGILLNSGGTAITGTIDTVSNSLNIAYVDSLYFNGYIDDLRITKGLARYTANFTPPTESLPTIPPTIPADPWWGNVSLLLDGNTTDAYDPYWQNVSLMLTGDDFIDWSNNHYSITKNGAVAIDNTTKKYNTGSIKITTADTDYCSTSAGAALGTSNFTIEFWFNSSSTSAYSGIFAIDNSSGGYAGIQLTRSGLFISYTSATWNMFGYGSTSMTAAFNGAWHHVAVCRSGASIYLFIDGVSVGTAYDISTNPIYAANAGVVLVGKQSTSTGFTGYIADFRITRNVARYTANFTPPIAALPSFKIQDRTQTNLTLTPYGNVQLSTDVMKNGTGSMFFDGTGDYLAVTPTTNLVLGTSDFTIEGWFYQTAGGTYAHLFTTTAGYTTANQLRMTNQSGTTLMVFSGGSTTLITASTTYTQNTWNHFALVRSGTTLTLYLNGISVGSNTSVSISFVADASWYIGSDSMNNYSWNGYIDDFRVTKGYARYTQNFTPPSQSFATQYISTGYDANYADVSLLLNGNGTNGSTTFTDLSSTPKTITAYGNAQISTSVKKYGTGAMYFDGSGDYLTTPPSSDLDLSSSDFTIEYWVNYTVVGQAPVVCKWTGSAGAWYAGILGTNLALGLTSSGSTASPELWLQSTGYTVPTSTWIHVAFVRSGTSVKLYINGALNNSGTFSGTVNSNSTTIRVGQNPDNSQNLNGYIDDLRITKGVARYTTNFTPPTYQLPTDTTGTVIDPLRSSTSLLLRGNGTNGSTSFTDESPNGLTVTNTGSVTVNTTTKKYGTGSMAFSGSNYLGLSSNALFNFGTIDFTMEGWFYKTVNGNVPGIVGNNKAWAANAWAVCVSHPTYPNTIGLYVYNMNNIAPIVVSTSTLSLNTWYHFAVTRSGSTIRLFLNGALEATGTSSASLNVADDIIAIGNNYGDYLNGYIDDLRITKGYARYTANFTPPTYEDPIVTGTVYDYNYPQVSLLLNGDGTNGSTVFTDLSSSPKTITNTGSVAVNTTTKKFGTGSMAFSGSNYLTISSASTGFSGDFTVEGWGYYSNSSGYATLFDARNAASSYAGILLYIIPSTSINVTVNSNTVIITGTQPVVNTWFHFALSRAGSSIYLFINGTQIGSTASNSTSFPANTLYIGAFCDPTANLNGYIDDLRITKGLARYTQNFTPPTAPLPTSYS